MFIQCDGMMSVQTVPIAAGAKLNVPAEGCMAKANLNTIIHADAKRENWQWWPKVASLHSSSTIVL